MALLFLLVVYAGFGAICATLAARRGRSAVGWFFIGAVFPLIGLILVLVLPNLREEQERLQRLSRENRRLKEIVKSERLVTDRRFVKVDRRLDAHDRALGIDTTDAGEDALGAESAPPPLPATDTARAADLDRDDWYYARGGERVGPTDLAGLRAAYARGELRPGSLVWCADFEDWRPLRAVPGLNDALET